jgi:hypothetical protein
MEDLKMQKMKNAVAVSMILAATAAGPMFAQAPPAFAPPQLDQLVQRIALYPDPLLAQILAGATYSNDIPAAAQWADQHHYLTGQALANAITGAGFLILRADDGSESLILAGGVRPA